MTSVTIDHGFNVRRPVFAAAGNVDDCVLKYAPYGQPNQHALRYWQADRPGRAFVAFAVRPGMMWRLPLNSFLSLPATMSSAQLSGIAGKNCPSGSCGNPSIEPAIPACFSTWSYQ